MNLNDFCSNVVPDFAPLGGNRPDCAVVMSIAVSLVDNLHQFPPSPSLFLLPPDVLDTAMAAVCAPVIIRSATHVVPPPHGSVRGGRLSCRLDVAPEGKDSLALFCFPSYDGSSDCEDHNMPWRNYANVTLRMILPNSITSCGDAFLAGCKSLAILDLRHGTLQTVGDKCFADCTQLNEVLHLPDTLENVGYGFLGCSSLVSIDLRNTKLQPAGSYFLYRCERLTEVNLPDTLHTVVNNFLQLCDSLSSIDLRNTKLNTTGSHFLYRCEGLTEAHLPDTLRTVGVWFLGSCSSLVSIDLRHTKLHTAGDHFLSLCGSLKEVNLPDTLSSVGNGFLFRCPKVPKERSYVARFQKELTQVITNRSEGCLV